MSSKAIIIGNDSMNRNIYENVYRWYKHALEFRFDEVHFMYTTLSCNEYIYDIFDEVKEFEHGSQLDEYDFVFVTLFSVDKWRQEYENATRQNLSKLFDKLIAEDNSYEANKVAANLDLIIAADYCKTNHMPYALYTFDPQLDMHVTGHTNYSFLPIYKNGVKTHESDRKSVV